MTGDQRPFDSTNKLTQRLDIDFALQAAGLGVWELDPVTAQVSWDDRCRELFGLAKHNYLPYEQALQYIHAEDVSQVNQAVQWAMNPQSNGYYDQTYRIIGADDGQLRWVRFYGRAYFSEAGELYRFAGVAQEVTQQIVAQQGEVAARHEAQWQQRIYEAITASTPDLIYVFDLNYRFTYVNQALLDMWGSSWEASIGKGLLENGYEPWHAQMHEREIDQVVATKQSIRGEVSFPHATLGKRIYDYVFAPVFNEQGEVEAIAGTTRDITDNRKAQELIQESEARFRSLIEEAPVATMLMVGPEYTIDVANDAMIRMLGRDSSIVGQPAIVAVPELASQTYLQLLDQVFASGNVYEAKAMPGELVINGVSELHYFDFTYKPLRNASGQVYGIISMAVDVTEQVQTLQLKDESQRQLLTLFEQSPVGLATLSADDELVFQWANAFYGELVARPPQAIVGKPLLEALPEIKGQGFDEILRNVIATGVPFIAPEIAVNILRDGQLTTIYINLTYQPRKGTQGDVRGILVVATDVTQQVLSRKEIEESESKLRAILATAPAGIGLFVGRDLVIENPNQTFIDIVGKGPNIAGLPLREAMPELLTEGQPFLKILDDVFTTGEPFISPASLVKIVQNGVLNDNYYNISYTPVYNASGQVYAILDIAIDVTEQVKAQQALFESEARYRRLSESLERQVQERTEELAAANEELAATNEELAASNEELEANNEEYAAINEELEEANRLLMRSNDDLQKFAYVASHDLQEPLRKIQQFSDLLKTRYSSSFGDELLYLDRMQAAASRMSALIRDLLDFSRVSSQRDMSRSVSLTDVVNRALTTLDLVIEETKATIIVEPLPTVIGDASQLDQLFQNLLSNALKFRHPDQPPRIHLTTQLVETAQLPTSVKPVRNASAYHRIDVADNGVGFDEKYLDRIFQVFQRLYGRNAYAGTGIGLAICEKVVANHGGAITARSQPGQGAIFSVYLPA